MKSDLMEIDDKFYKKAKVVMLATKTKSKLSITNENANVQLGLQYFEDYYEPDKMHDNQHLYIISDEDVKENDNCCVLSKLTSNAIQLLTFKGKKPKNFDLKKIIATTDFSLGILSPCPVRGSDSSIKHILPRPSDSFIEKYCEKYNKGEVIEEVLVEYEETVTQGQACALGWTESDMYDYNLKIAPDNTVTIKPVIEETYTRQEVEQLLWKAYTAKLDKMSPDDISDTLIPEFDKWVEKNL